MSGNKWDGVDRRTWSYDRVEMRLLRIAKLLNAFNIAELVILGFLCYKFGELLDWYQAISTPETFNPTAFWGACTALGAGIIGLVKYIFHTGESLKDSFKN